MKYCGVATPFRGILGDCLQDGIAAKLPTSIGRQGHYHQPTQEPSKEPSIQRKVEEHQNGWQKDFTNTSRGSHIFTR
jgi:hypothetical protein